MGLLVAAVAMAMSVGAEAPTSRGESFPRAVRLIRSADYRGARADLERMAASLDAERDPALAPYRDYWRGFARWRRALNGFNETPLPEDLSTDLTAAIASFKAALVEKPGWVEAKIGIVGCVGPLLYLARHDTPRRDSLLKEFLPMVNELREAAADNPRWLWTMGQSQLGGGGGATGPQPAMAAATFHRGVEAALAEASRVPADEPVWVPRWGGAENLMNLAYLYTHSTLANRDLALAYVEGALVAAPEWHFVRDILGPQAAALTQPSPGPAAGPATR